MTTRSASSRAWPARVDTPSGAAVAEPAVELAGSRRPYARELPVMVEGELDRMVGMIPLVRMLGGMLGSLGVLAAVASVTLGLPVLTAMGVLWC